MNKKFKLFESGDKIEHSGYKLHHKDKDALPFAFNYINGLVRDFWIGEYRKPHHFPEHNLDREHLGRVWKDKKVMTFWIHPSKEIMADCIKTIENKLNLKIFNNDWQIEIKKRVPGDAYHHTKIKYWLEPIDQYSGSEIEIDTKAYTDHLDKKKNKHVQGNFGSNKARSPLSVRQKMYAESLKLLNVDDDSIETVLNIKANFMLCKRCGNQLHHGIRICNNCGKNNGINNGSTIKQMLYTGKHRQITKKPLFITPEIIYDTHKGQMPGVSLEEFIDYVDNSEIDKPISKPVTSGGSVKYAKRKPLAYRQKMYQESKLYEVITTFENFNAIKDLEKVGSGGEVDNGEIVEIKGGKKIRIKAERKSAFINSLKETDSFTVIAEDLKGNEIGRANIKKHKGDFYVRDAETVDGNKRQGVMTSIYDYIEKNGYKLKETERTIRTDAGKALAHSRKFVDNFEGVAFDDELMLSTEEFYRPLKIIGTLQE